VLSLCHHIHQHSALIVELIDLPTTTTTTTSYVIDVVNCHAVDNADATCPSIVSVQNRLRFVRYCSKFDIVFIHYDSYYHMLYESAY